MPLENSGRHVECVITKCALGYENPFKVDSLRNFIVWHASNILDIF